MVIALAGLPGSGKSFLANEIVRRYPNFILYNKDTVRNALFPKKLTDFSSAQNDLCMDVIFQAVAYLLAKDPNRVIFIDGRTFSSKKQVDAILEFTTRIQVLCKFVYCTCSEETARERIVKDQNQHLAKNRDMNLYYSLKEHADPLTVPYLRLETDDPDLLDERVTKVLAYIGMSESGE